MLKVWGKFDVAELRGAFEGEPVGSASR
jgi:hypothetical protein